MSSQLEKGHTLNHTLEQISGKCCEKQIHLLLKHVRKKMDICKKKTKNITNPAMNTVVKFENLVERLNVLRSVLETNDAGLEKVQGKFCSFCKEVYRFRYHASQLSKDLLPRDTVMSFKTSYNINRKQHYDLKIADSESYDACSLDYCSSSDGTNILRRRILSLGIGEIMSLKLPVQVETKSVEHLHGHAESNLSRLSMADLLKSHKCLSSQSDETSTITISDPSLICESPISDFEQTELCHVIKSYVLRGREFEISELKVESEHVIPKCQNSKYCYDIRCSCNRRKHLNESLSGQVSGYSSSHPEVLNQVLDLQTNNDAEMRVTRYSNFFKLKNLNCSESVCCSNGTNRKYSENHEILKKADVLNESEVNHFIKTKSHTECHQPENVLYVSAKALELPFNKQNNENMKSSMKSRFWFRKVDFFYRQREIEVWTARSIATGNNADKKVETTQGSRNTTTSDPVLSQVSNPDIMELNETDSSMSVFVENSGINTQPSDSTGPFLEGIGTGLVNPASSGTSADSTSERSVRFSQSFHIPSFGDPLSFDIDDDQSNEVDIQFINPGERNRSQTESAEARIAEDMLSQPETIGIQDASPSFDSDETEPNDKFLLAKSYLEDMGRPEQNAPQKNLRGEVTENSDSSKLQQTDTQAKAGENVQDADLIDYLSHGNTAEEDSTMKESSTPGKAAESKSDADDLTDRNCEFNKETRICDRLPSYTDKLLHTSDRTYGISMTVSNSSNNKVEKEIVPCDKSFHKDSVDEKKKVREKTDSISTIKKTENLHVNSSDTSVLWESSQANLVSHIQTDSDHSRAETQNSLLLAENTCTNIAETQNSLLLAKNTCTNNGENESCKASLSSINRVKENVASKKGCSNSNICNMQTCGKADSVPGTRTNEDETSESDSENRLMIDCTYDSDHGNCVADDDSGDDEDDFEAEFKLSSAKSVESQKYLSLLRRNRSDSESISSVASIDTGRETCKQLKRYSSEPGESIGSEHNNSDREILQPFHDGTSKTRGEKTSPFQDHSYVRSNTLLGNANLANNDKNDNPGAVSSFVKGRTLTAEQPNLQTLDGKKMIVSSALSEEQKKNIFDSYEQYGIEKTCRTHNIPVEKLREVLKEYFESKLNEVKNLIESKPDMHVSEYGKAKEATNTKEMPKHLHEVPEQKDDESSASQSLAKDDTQTVNVKDYIFDSKTTATQDFDQNLQVDDRSKKSNDILEASELIQFKINVEDFVTNKLGRRLYSYDFKKRSVALAEKFGDVLVANHVGIDKKTIGKWRYSCAKLAQNEKLIIEDGKPKVEDKEDAKKKRFRYSENLKIKLVYMAKTHGVSDVVKQYGVKKSTLQQWNQIYGERKLQSYELTDEDLLELVEGAEHSEMLSKTPSQTDQQVTEYEASSTVNLEKGNKHTQSANADLKAQGKESVCRTSSSDILAKPESGKSSTENTFPGAIPVILEAPPTSEELKRPSEKYQAVASLLRKALAKVPPDKQGGTQPSAAFIHGNSVVFRYDMPKTPENSVTKPLVIKPSQTLPGNLSTTSSPVIVSSSPLCLKSVSANSVVAIKTSQPDRSHLIQGAAIGTVEPRKDSFANISSITTAASECSTTPYVKIVNIQQVLPPPPALHKYGQIGSETIVQSTTCPVMGNDCATTVTTSIVTSVISDCSGTPLAQTSLLNLRSISNRQSETSHVSTPLSISQIKQEPQNDYQYAKAVGYSPTVQMSGSETAYVSSGIPASVSVVQPNSQISTGPVGSQSVPYRNSCAPGFIKENCPTTVYVFNHDGRIDNITNLNSSNSSARNTGHATSMNSGGSFSTYNIVHRFPQTTFSTTVHPSPRVTVGTTHNFSHTLSAEPRSACKEVPIILKKSTKKSSPNSGISTVSSESTASPETFGSDHVTKDMEGYTGQIPKRVDCLRQIPKGVDYLSEFKKQMGIEKEHEITTESQQMLNREIQLEVKESQQIPMKHTGDQKQTGVVKRLDQFLNAINQSKISIDLLYQQQLLEQLKKSKRPEQLKKIQQPQDRLGLSEHQTEHKKQNSPDSRLFSLIKSVSGRIRIADGSKSLCEVKSPDKISVPDKMGSSPSKNSALSSDKYIVGKNFRFSRGLKVKLAAKASMEKTSVSTLAKRYDISEKCLNRWRSLYAGIAVADTKLTKKQQEEVAAHRLWLAERKSLAALKTSQNKDFQIYIDNPESPSVSESVDDVSILEHSNSAEAQLTEHVDNLSDARRRNDSTDCLSVTTGTSIEETIAKPENKDQSAKSGNGDNRTVTDSDYLRQKDLEKDISNIQTKILKKNTARKSTTQGKVVSKFVKKLGNTKESVRSVEKEDAFHSDVEQSVTRIKEKSRVPSPMFNVPLYIEAQAPDITNKERNDIRKSWTFLFGKTNKPKGVFEATEPHLTGEDGDVPLKPPSTSNSTDSADLPNVQIVIVGNKDSSDKMHVDQQLANSGHELHENVSKEKASDENVVIGHSSNEYEDVTDRCVFEDIKTEKLYPIAGDLKYSLEFKLKIVKEAQESGCENAAKWYKLDLDEVRKWHAAIEGDKHFSFKLSVVNCAKIYGIRHAASLYSIDQHKISKWLSEKIHDTLTLNETSGIFEEKDKWEGLQFETVKNGDVSILKPKFNRTESTYRGDSPTDMEITSNNRTRTRMGGNSVSFISKQTFSKACEIVHSSSSKDLEKEYLADIEGDIGAMPRIVRQKSTNKAKNDSELEIASTWKQVQEYVQQPVKSKEKKFSPDFKARIIKLCAQKGQKTVAKEHKIPYNKISRWRLKAKNGVDAHSADMSKNKPADSALVIKINLKDEPKVMSPTSQDIDSQKSEFSEDFKKEVVKYSRKHGFIAAAREFKIGNPRILSWIRQYRSCSFDSNEIQSTMSAGELSPVKDFQKYKTKKVKSPRQSYTHVEVPHSPKGNKTGRKTPVNAESVLQDYIISKSTLGKENALKITLSPRRKSPALSKASSDEGSEIDDFEEVAAWSADTDEIGKSDGNTVIELSDDDDVIIVREVDLKSKSRPLERSEECIIINDEERVPEVNIKRNESGLKEDELTFKQQDIELNSFADRKRADPKWTEVAASNAEDDVLIKTMNVASSNVVISEDQLSNTKPVSGNLYDLLETEEDTAHIENVSKQDEDDKNKTISADSRKEKENLSQKQANDVESRCTNSAENLENFKEDSEMLSTERKMELAVVLHDYRSTVKENVSASSTECADDSLCPVPYEETLMYKVLSQEMDKFFTGSFEVSKLLSEIGDNVNTGKNEAEKPKKSTVKKRKMTADVEIMENLDEQYRQYLFGPQLLPEEDEFIHEGNHAEHESEETYEKELEESNENIEVNLDGKEVDSAVNESLEEGKASNAPDVHDLGEEKADAVTSEFPVCSEGERVNSEPEEKNARGLFEDLFPNFSVPKEDVLKAEESNQKEAVKSTQSRNLFDFLTPVSTTEATNKNTAGVDKVDQKGENATQTACSITTNDNSTDQSENDPENSRASPFRFFGSLMKSIKLPASLALKNLSGENTTERGDESNQNGSIIAETQASEESELNSRQEIDKKSESKDKGTRNLFDFLSPNSNQRDTLESHSPENFSSPVPGLFENLKSKQSNETKIKQQDNVKPLQSTKPAFKFLSVNFSQIAKLGMAKFKENKSQLKETDRLMEEGTNTLSSPDNFKAVGTQKDSSVNEEILSGNGQMMLKTIDNENMSDEKNLKDTAEDGIKVNSTPDSKVFECNDREKLDKDNLIKEEEPEKKSCIENNSAYEEDDDDELYKSFTSQKVILILDISKKHGIEFASTSFGLPPRAIVNWIIEKDRKHRKIASSYTLEEKLNALKLCLDVGMADASSSLKISVDTIKSWKNEMSWLLDSPGVLDVLEKWSKIQSRTSISLDDGKVPSELTGSANEKNILKQESVENLDSVGGENNPIEESKRLRTTSLEEVPDILNFAKNTHPKDFTVEQKAVIVLLLDKYGVSEVNRKLGISTRTLWGWKYRAKAARDYIRADAGQVNQKRKLSQNVETDIEKQVNVTTPHKAPACFKNVNMNNNDSSQMETKLKPHETQVMEAKFCISETNYKVESLNKLSRPAVVKSPMKGYRMISPTKIPEILHDVRKLPTKDFSLEQRVAIVKLVDLYGVRTVHKQFRIPAGSIWNWQHSKTVMDLARPEGGVEKGKKNLEFDDSDAARLKPDTIEIIMERVKNNLKSLNHLQFNSHQKADAVCLVNHYSVDTVVKALRVIPRGTLWNWRHNKYVSKIVEKKMQLLQEGSLSKKTTEKETSKLSENQDSDLSEHLKFSMDKKDLTQKWLSLCHGVSRRTKSPGAASLTESNLLEDKKVSGDNLDLGNYSDNSECSEHSDHHLYEEIDLELGESFNSTSGRLTRSSSSTRMNITPSIVSSVSIHSGDFEEIISDDEQSKSSRSKIMGSTQKRKGHCDDRDVKRQNKKRRSENSEVSSDIDQFEDLKDEIIEVPEFEVVDFKISKDNRMLVSYKVVGTKEVYLSTGEEGNCEEISLVFAFSYK